MDSPISPLVASLFMEQFESKAINTAPNPPWLWLRYVDDTFVIQQAEHIHQLLQHINSFDKHIQFIAKILKDNGSSPFLDTLVYQGPNNILTTPVY